eukprot:2811-Prorocentrum_minimum.AAC.1
MPAPRAQKLPVVPLRRPRRRQRPRATRRATRRATWRAPARLAPVLGAAPLGGVSRRRGPGLRRGGTGRRRRRRWLPLFGFRHRLRPVRLLLLCDITATASEATDLET